MLELPITITVADAIKCAIPLLNEHLRANNSKLRLKTLPNLYNCFVAKKTGRPKSDFPGKFLTSFQYSFISLAMDLSQLLAKSHVSLIVLVETADEALETEIDREKSKLSTTSTVHSQNEGKKLCFLPLT